MLVPNYQAPRANPIFFSSEKPKGEEARFYRAPEYLILAQSQTRRCSLDLLSEEFSNGISGHPIHTPAAMTHTPDESEATLSHSPTGTPSRRGRPKKVRSKKDAREWISVIENLYADELDKALEKRTGANINRSDVFLKFLCRQLRKLYANVLPKAYHSTRNLSKKPTEAL